MSNKQQTAVEWLENQLLKQKSILKNHFEEGKWNDDRCDEIDNCLLFIQQAKEMEKEQRSIKLPSDEQIKKMMELDGMEFDEFDPYDVSYLGGATWMRNKIQGGEK